MANDVIFKLLIGRSRKFLAPYLRLMDAWRQEFVPQLFKGMIQARGLVVTEISRALKQPDEALDAVWQRIRRHVRSEEWKKFDADVRLRFAQDRAEGIGEHTPVAVDLSDLSKPYATQLQYLAIVRDGSESSLRGGTVLNPGYWLFQSYLALGPEGQPVPVVCFPFSVEDPRVGSQNRAVEEGFQQLAQALKGKGVWYLDRGFDAERVFEALEVLRVRFVCRLIGTRTLVDPDGESLGRAHDVASRMRLTHEVKLPAWKNHKRRKDTLGVAWRTVRIPGTSEAYTFIRISGLDSDEVGMMLLTNVPIRGWADVVRVVRDYSRRWRAEDAIRLLKQELGIEKVRVFDFESIRRLVEFSFWILALISLISLDLSPRQRERVTDAAAAWATPILLYHYRILAALRCCLARHGPDFLRAGRWKEAKV